MATSVEGQEKQDISKEWHLDVVASVEGLEVKLLVRLGGPQAQVDGVARLEARHWVVVCDRGHPLPRVPPAHRRAPDNPRPFLELSAVKCQEFVWGWFLPPRSTGAPVHTNDNERWDPNLIRLIRVSRTPVHTNDNERWDPNLIRLIRVSRSGWLETGPRPLLST